MKYSDYQKTEDLKIYNYFADMSGIDKQTGMINDFDKYMDFRIPGAVRETLEEIANEALKNLPSPEISYIEMTPEDYEKIRKENETRK